MKPASANSSRLSLSDPPRSTPSASAISHKVSDFPVNVRRMSPLTFALSPKTSLNRAEKSLKSGPSGVKHILLTFSDAERAGLISSRYRGTPPVTDKTSSKSRVCKSTRRSPQNRAQRLSGSSLRTMSLEKRPPNVALSRRFSLIHADTEPQTASIRLSCGFR